LEDFIFGDEVYGEAEERGHDDDVGYENDGENVSRFKVLNVG
jgi:hypothetical protein